MKFWSWLLLPFAAIYALITDFRKYLYQKKVFRSDTFEVPTISIGNLRVGGTGKTPHIEMLINIFAPTHQIATLSRGYGRATQGFRLADASDTPQTLGDEPMQFYEKFGKQIKVAVGEKRASAIPQLLRLCPEINLILLDDAFQHLAVVPSCSILLTEYARPFYQDFVLPMGRLRERRKAASRANIIIVSKCPSNISPQNQNQIKKYIHQYAPHTPIFFTKLSYKKPYFLVNKNLPVENVKKVVLLAAIANPDYFLEEMQKQFDCHAHLFFPDHHFFNDKDVLRIAEATPADACLLCTEKDAQKLSQVLPRNLLEKTLVMPIEVEFLEEQMKNEFLKSLRAFLG